MAKVHPITGKVTALEGGDIATIALMAAHIAVHSVNDADNLLWNPSAHAENATTLYVETLNAVNKFNQKNKAAK